MEVAFPLDPKRLRKFNFAKYKGIPPSWELIESVIKKSGLKRLARFECVWLMPTDTLTWYKNGKKVLPAKYWHIFYEFEAINQKYVKTFKKSKKSYKSTV